MQEQLSFQKNKLLITDVNPDGTYLEEHLDEAGLRDYMERHGYGMAIIDDISDHEERETPQNATTSEK